MQAIDGLNRRLEEADTITSVLLAGWDAFELIQQLPPSTRAFCPARTRPGCG